MCTTSFVLGKSSIFHGYSISNYSGAESKHNYHIPRFSCPLIPCYFPTNTPLRLLFCILFTLTKKMLNQSADPCLRGCTGKDLLNDHEVFQVMLKDTSFVYSQGKRNKISFDKSILVYFNFFVRVFILTQEIRISHI